MRNEQLSILVALHSGNLSGVETYAEQVATAAAGASHIVTLVAVGGGQVPSLEARMGAAGVRVVRTRAFSGSRWRSVARRVPTFGMAELARALHETLTSLGERFDVAHLNHPALAPVGRAHAGRVVVGGWFYPHSPGGRVLETWRHTGSAFPRSAAFALKGLLHYWNDRQGYAASDCVVAPTVLFAGQLEAAGIHAIACPPPGRQVEMPAASDGFESRRATGARRITMICGDLTHPRKNVVGGIRGVGLLAAAGAGWPIHLELIGRHGDLLAGALGALPESVQVTASGQLPREQVDERLRQTDLLVVPSLYEEWGYVVTEAVLAGTPVVAYPVYPFIEVLTPPLGRCADDMSPESLARAMKLTLESGPGRAVVAGIARQKFGAGAVAEKLSEIWSGSTRQPVVTLGGRRG